ncbi:MAG: adenosylcobinamide-phosphate synthase CbiB [Bacteroides sp.]|nr:adenosylcobinamide-phosphate synthase CbiB [Roseburia sp.]MCM1345574.1 adenosylcobinamide-phosphate synthase CbiB [Bacteroides sp.]MCM1421271.1 adenosylcobinamide-phosphate synthase CbiB [Bacteroides sp.]
MNIYLIILILPLITGWILDYMFGDPERLPHPVVLFGRIISFGEKRLNKGRHKKIKGGVFAVACILGVYILLQQGLSWCLQYAPFIFSTNQQHGMAIPSSLFILLYVAICSILIFYCLAGKTLRKEVRMTFKAVDRSTEEGRRQVGRIVGRDTSELTPQEIRTAALETLAENLSDGVIAPLFWLFLLGVPGMMAYKMVNTLDSMIGYQNERYKDFGCWAAKIDDFANYVPARLTAILMILASCIVCHNKSCKQESGGCMKNISAMKRLKLSFAFVAHFGPQHASPNSGWPEAALASILNCRFGGPHNYFGEYFYKPYIGTNPRPLTTGDMYLSLRVSVVAESMMILLLTLFYSTYLIS